MTLRLLRPAIGLLLAVFLIGHSAAADATPRYIVYYNAPVTPLADTADTDFSHVLLAFWTVPETGTDAPLALVPPKAMAGQWDAIPRLAAAGKTVMLSFGGGDMTEAAWASVVGREAEVAQQLAAVVRQRQLHGVDIDFEVSPALEHGSHRPFDGKTFLIDLTRALHTALPPGSLISHAPQAPYLSRSWHGAPYLDVMRAVGAQIDWLGIQYYNNPSYDAPIASHLVGSGAHPRDSSVAGLVAGAGGLKIPVGKIVVGKPIYHADAANGHLAPADVRSRILDPLLSTYGDAVGGLMGWQFADDTDDHRAWNHALVKDTPLAEE